jgi:hypothetical protein
MLSRRAGLLSFIPCGDWNLGTLTITASFEFLVHATTPAGVVGADTRLSRKMSHYRISQRFWN